AAEAGRASSLASAAGAHSAEADAAAATARRQAAEATRAAGVSQTLAKDSAAAAYKARDAANSAADHAERAAKAAEEAAKQAGKSAQAAKESAVHAANAKKAADVATGAVEDARTTFALTRKSEAEELVARTAAATEAAKESKAADDLGRAQADKAAKSASALDTVIAQISDYAAKPDADTGRIAAKGRWIALVTMKSRGPWSGTAAATALAGSDADVVEYLRTGWKEAAEQDERARAERLADDADSPAVRQAAEKALGGDAQQIHAFLTTGQHEVAANDYRLRISQAVSAGGPATKEAAVAALDGGIDAMRAFLMTGQYTARTNDERLRASQLISTGGPELKAAARVAIEGAPRMLHDFIEVGQYRAKRKDALAATHIADVQRLISGAATVAARSQQNAAEANRAAALANKKAGEAKTWADKAGQSAADAKKFAAEAAKSASEAETSAAQARESAKAARKAQADAVAASREAGISAQEARASAAWARVSASDAQTAAQEARASAVAAGKDSSAADKSAKEAKAIAEVKRRAEEEARRRDEEARKKREEDLRRAAEEEEEGSDWTWSDTGHLALDIVGLFPGAGEFADGANCAWYGTEGDALNAGLSCASAVPVAGYGASAVKFSKWGDKAYGLLKGMFGKGAKACKVPNSFTPETPVAMADGTTKQIQHVRLGDHVLATDPVTGTTGPQTVQRVITGEGAKRLVRLTIDTDGARGNATGSFTATDNHPLWLVDQNSWIPAGQVQPGDRLRAPDGTLRTVVATRGWAQKQQVYNLTVSNAHTFYVLAGSSPVLVHNDGGIDWDKALEDIKKNWDGGDLDDDGHHSPGGNQAENKQFKDAVHEVERALDRDMTPGERRALHDRITGRGYGYHRIIEEGKGMFGGC
ncbi:polymorphic toxin-type HINT domain-containing protein, partial [Streptomyces sp.]|uniref:polymorphic toxin-type HINT domain-containing protein n=1 Tax=Streptomyces sp. TaxID=1931 RepID=UPI002D7A3ED9